MIPAQLQGIRHYNQLPVGNQDKHQACGNVAQLLSYIDDLHIALDKADDVLMRFWHTDRSEEDDCIKRIDKLRDKRRLIDRARSAIKNAKE